MPKLTLRALATALVALLALPAFSDANAQPAPAQQSSRAAPSGPGIFALLPPSASTRHTFVADGKTLAYSAEAGALPLRDAKGETNAQVFYVAYSLDPADRARPLTFVFNGGPGAAATFLNLGALGPRALTFSREGQVLPPPAQLSDNPDTWLGFTDLVFVDPPGTGYSRGVDTQTEQQFWGVRQDADAMAAFIRLYLERTNRMLSPIFLAGESYGGFRAALLAKSLPADSGIQPSGVVLISPALEFSLIFNGSPFELLPSALALPSMAAVNLERQGVHGAVALGSRLKDVESFALSDYLVDIARPSGTGSRAVAERVAREIGLPVDVVERQSGRVPISLFIKEYDRAGSQLLSRYDGAVGGPDPNPANPRPSGPDAVLDRSVPAWTSAFIDYVREELNFRTDLTYRLLNREVSGKWDYGAGRSRQGYAGVMDDLQEARVHNPRLQVLIAQGYTDLVTPYLGSRYLVEHMPHLAGAAPIDLKVYEGGHMMYMRPESRHGLEEDAKALYMRALEAALPPKSGIP